MTAPAPTPTPVEASATSTSPEDWLRVRPAAKRLALSDRQLYRVVEQRLVPFRRVPGTSVIAFAPEDLKAIADMSLVKPLNS